MNLLSRITYYYERAFRYFHNVGIKTAIKNLRQRYFFTGKDVRNAKKTLGQCTAELSEYERMLIDKVSDKIHMADAMYSLGNARKYFEVGLSACRCIEKAIAAAKMGIPLESVLDFPCGYGRVLRFLVLKYPAASFTAGDIDANAVQFCHKTFKSLPAISNKNINRLDLKRKFSLIWCGSLLTHIAEADALALLLFFKRHLATNGLCVFTTISYQSIEWMQQSNIKYGISKAGCEKIVKEFWEKGYGYAAYPDNPDLGISAVTPAYVLKLAAAAGLREIFLEEKGWANHLDVYGYTLS
jgi:SAM-dependent methyltransferase